MKLYVGNLNYKTNEAELREMFSQYGEVTSAAVIMDRETGRSKGFGFVELSDEQAGRAAIEALDGKEVGGRALKVNEARPPQGGGGFGGDRRGGGGGGFSRDRDRGGRGGGDRGGWR